MCCAVEYPNLIQKMGVTNQRFLSYALPTKMSKTKVETKMTTQAPEGLKESPKAEETEPCVRPKTKPQVKSDTIEEDKKKKKKWKAVPLSELCFNMSLFPRPTRPELIDPEEEAKIIEKIENEIVEYDKVVEKYCDFDSTETELFEGNCKKMDKLSRADRDRKVKKAGKQVKDKHCTSVKNNKGRKQLYIHHRLFKLINIEVRRLSHYLPSYSSNKSSTETKSRLKPYSATPAHNTHRPAPVQNLRYALQKTNAAAGLETGLVNVLINLQHRDLTPEDYDLLLRLDETVAPKTIDKSLLDNFRTDTVDENSSGDICPVCMEAYAIGQDRKFLPCNHVFHSKCINMWLENSSRNCPIDGLPVDEGS